MRMLRDAGGIENFDNVCLLVGGKSCGYKGQGDVYTTSGQYLTVYFSKDSTLQYAEFDMTLTSYHTGKKHHILLIRKFSRGLYFRKTSHMRSFVKIKSSRNAEITLSFTYMRKSWPSREFLASQICL